MTAPPAIIFDLDGTLIDSVPDLHAAVNRMLASEGKAPMDRAEVQSYVGNGAPVLVARVLAARDIDMGRHKTLTDQMIADYTKRSAELTEVYPNVAKALSDLQAKGYPLGICTNKPGAATTSVLAALKLDTYFDAVIAGDTLAEKKPHPAPLFAARDVLGATACLYVGDSEVDSECAAAAEIPFALYTEGYLRVPRETIRFDAGFSDFCQLPGIVSRLF
ncbi:MAG: phosphoglycolate phosphatase [Paracoccaceae bacterium]|nr:phosphoglycolate phosphatase [Paracoccaceae bacterium]